MAVARRSKDGNDFQCDEKRSEMFQWKEGDTVSWMIQRACCKLYFLQYMCMYEYVSILLQISVWKEMYVRFDGES